MAVVAVVVVVVVAVVVIAAAAAAAAGGGVGSFLLPTTLALHHLERTSMLLGICGTFVISYHFLSQNPLVDFANSNFGFRQGLGAVKVGECSEEVMTTRLRARAFYAVFTVVSQCPTLLAASNSNIHLSTLQTRASRNVVWQA